MSCEIVLQRAGYACIDQLARNEYAARTGDSEGIHQIRVAVRRWRATLSALAPFMPQGLGARPRTNCAGSPMRSARRETSMSLSRRC